MPVSNLSCAIQCTLRDLRVLTSKCLKTGSPKCEHVESQIASNKTSVTSYSNLQLAHYSLNFPHKEKHIFFSINYEMTGQAQTQAVARQTVTLREVLTRDKPPWDLDWKPYGGGEQNFRKNPWSWIHFWKGFSRKSIDAVAGEFLDREIPAHELPVPDPSEAPWIGKTIRNRVDMRLMSSWFIDVLSPTVNFAASALKLDAGAELTFAATKVDERVPNDLGEFVFGIESPKQKGFVVGKVWDQTREWSYDRIRHRYGKGDATKLVTPLSWLIGLAARRGYASCVFILTPDHIVLCARKVEEDGSCKSHWVMPVPLFGTSPNGLTAELGLWTLCMIGLLDHVQRQQAKKAEPDTDAGKDADEDDNPWGKPGLLDRLKAELFKPGFVVEECSDDDDANEDQTSLV